MIATAIINNCNESERKKKNKRQRWICRSCIYLISNFLDQFAVGEKKCGHMHKCVLSCMCGRV